MILRRFIQRAPVAFLQSTIVQPVIQCAISAIALDHKEANASVTKFLVDTVRAGSEDDVSVVAVVQQQCVYYVVFVIV